MAHRIGQRSFPEVKIVSLAWNKRFSGAVNEGIRRQRGEFIALLNNDTVAGSQVGRRACKRYQFF